MDDKRRIEDMRENGRITAEQADMLKKAVEESERRRVRAAETAADVRKKRSGVAFRIVMRLAAIVVLAVVLLPAASFYFRPASFSDDVISYTEGEGPSAEKIQDRERTRMRKDRRQATAMIFFVVVIAGVGAATGLLFMLLHNGLVLGEENVSKAWADIEMFLQRKLDLLPALAQAAEAGAAHERDTLSSVIEARTKAHDVLMRDGEKAPDDGESMDAVASSGRALSEAFRSLSALAESYPEIKTDEAFLLLQQETAHTENMIAGARKKYNECVRIFNTAMQWFPSNMAASVGGFKVKQYYEREA